MNRRKQKSDDMKSTTDILFIYPPTGWDQDAMKIAENDAPPLGLLYVAASARQAGMNVAVLDMNHPPISDSALADLITKTRPRLVALSVLSTSSPQAKRLAAKIKGQFPDIGLIAGGIHPTVLPQDMLGAGVDYVVEGEGEATIVELAQHIFDGKSLENIPGLVYYDSQSTKELIRTPRRKTCMDLDTLPLPARDLVPIKEYGQSGALCSSRGCPYTCSFCSSVSSNGHQYRQRSISQVIEEMQYMDDAFGIERFQFLDDNFTADLDRAAALSESLLDRGYIWSCQTTIMELAERIDVLDLMFEAGCREVYFGLETGSRRLMRKFKGIDLGVALTVLSHSASIHNNSESKLNRLQTVVGFIIGHPEDDEESIEETIQFALRLRKLGIDTMLSIMQPYPGSLIHSQPELFGVKIENSDYSQYLYPKANISTSHLSRERIRSLYASGLLRVMKTYREKI